MREPHSRDWIVQDNNDRGQDYKFCSSYSLLEVKALLAYLLIFSTFQCWALSSCTGQNAHRNGSWQRLMRKKHCNKQAGTLAGSFWVGKGLDCHCLPEKFVQKNKFKLYKWPLYCWYISSHRFFFFLNLTLKRNKFVMLVKVPVDSTQSSCWYSSCSGKKILWKESQKSNLAGNKKAVMA